MPDSRPTRTEVAAELKALRERAGYSNSRAAREIGTPQSGLSRYERGELLVPENVIGALLALYAAHTEVPTELRDRLLAGARENQNRQRPPQIRLHRADAADRQIDYGKLEEAATRVTSLGMTLVPGLLQTEAYMRAVVTAGRQLSEDRLEVWVANRRWRQRLLTETGRTFIQLVSGPALLWALGGAEVMGPQLEHLALASRLPSVRLGVIPPTAAVDVVPLHNIDLYERVGGERTVVVGTLGGTVILDDPPDLDTHQALIDRLGELAVWGDDARAELDRLAAWYGG